MLFWIVITATVFALTIIFGDYLKAKSVHQKKQNNIVKRLKKIEKRHHPADKVGE
jgi:hypothetical protein